MGKFDEQRSMFLRIVMLKLYNRASFNLQSYKTLFIAKDKYLVSVLTHHCLQKRQAHLGRGIRVNQSQVRAGPRVTVRERNTWACLCYPRFYMALASHRCLHSVSCTLMTIRAEIQLPFTLVGRYTSSSSWCLG